jgi:peptidoglycan/LPS O-acetylase OafA/YrhL
MNGNTEQSIDTKPKFITNLSGFRAIAAILIAFSHFGTPFSENSKIAAIAYRGYSGVTAFLILSGFVLTWSQLTKNNSKVSSNKRFFIDRISRIYPLHLITMLLAIVLLGIPKFNLLTVLSHITLTQAWLPDIESIYTYNSVSWALSVEIFLYLCFPTLYWICKKGFDKYRNTSALAIIVIGVLIPTIVFLLLKIKGNIYYPIEQQWSAHYFLYRFPITRLGDFIIGIGLAFLVYYSKPISKRTKISLQILSAILYLFMASNYVYTFDSILGALSFDLMWIPIFVLAIYSLSIESKTTSRNVLSWSPIINFGMWSFAFYLTHNTFFLYLKSLKKGLFFTGSVNFAVSVTLLLIFLVILSKYLFKYIELPLQKKIRNKLIK